MTHQSQSTSLKSSLAKFTWGHAFFKINGPLIKRYRTCQTSDDVIAMQETIQKEMEEEKIARKREMAEWMDGDLLRGNPNHVHDSSGDSANASEDEQQDDGPGEDLIETATAKMSTTRVAP